MYATFDYMQRGIGNGSCGPGTESAYTCPSYTKVSHTMRVSTVNGADTGIGEVGVKECVVNYDAASQQLVCSNLPARATVTVVNFGGVAIGKATAVGGEAAVSLQTMPKAPYVVIIRDGNEVRTHRFIKW